MGKYDDFKKNIKAIGTVFKEAERASSLKGRIKERQKDVTVMQKYAGGKPMQAFEGRRAAQLIAERTGQENYARDDSGSIAISPTARKRQNQPGGWR